MQVAFCSFDLVGIDSARLGQNLNYSAQQRVILFPLDYADALSSLNDDAHALIDPLHALDHHERADFKQICRLRVSVVGAIRTHSDASEQLFLRRQCCFDCGERARPADTQRHHCLGKDREVL